MFPNTSWIIHEAMGNPSISRGYKNLCPIQSRDFQQPQPNLLRFTIASLSYEITGKVENLAIIWALQNWTNLDLTARYLYCDLPQKIHHNTIAWHSKIDIQYSRNGEDNVEKSAQKKKTVESLPFLVPQWRELNDIEGPNKKTPPLTWCVTLRCTLKMSSNENPPRGYQKMGHCNTHAIKRQG